MSLQGCAVWVFRLLLIPSSANAPCLRYPQLALTAYRVLGAALSLAGGLASITCSLVLPTAFYARLAWGGLRWPARTGLAALLAVGVALVLLITGTNICDMLGQRCHLRQHHASGSSGDAAVGAWVPLLPWAQ